MDGNVSDHRTYYMQLDICLGIKCSSSFQTSLGNKQSISSLVMKRHVDMSTTNIYNNAKLPMLLKQRLPQRYLNMGLLLGWML